MSEFGDSETFTGVVLRIERYRVIVIEVEHRISLDAHIEADLLIPRHISDLINHHHKSSTDLFDNV